MVSDVSGVCNVTSYLVRLSHDEKHQRGPASEGVLALATAIKGIVVFEHGALLLVDSEDVVDDGASQRSISSLCSLLIRAIREVVAM